MKNIKIFFIDLDGTLIDETKKLRASQKNINMLRKINKNEDADIVISTGRIGEIPNIIQKQIDSKYSIQGNGSLVVDNNQNIIYKKCVPNEIANHIINYVRDNKLQIYFNEEKNIFGVNDKNIMPESLNYPLKIHSHYDVDQSMDFFKINIWHKSISKIKTALSYINQNFKNINVTLSNGNSIEITNIDANKGKTNYWLAKTKFNISDKAKLAHIGDSMNDASVYGYCETIIAMKNSNKQFLKYATHIGPSFENAGIAKLFSNDDAIIKNIK